MDFSSQLDGLEQQVVVARSTVQTASAESREQLRQRIDQAKVDQTRATKRSSTGNKWNQLKADAAEKMSGVEARIEKRNRQIDADLAESDAEFAESDAAAAIDFAAWTVDNARLAILDAIDARAYADMRADSADA